MKKHVKISRNISSVFLILLFVLTAVAYFFAFQYFEKELNSNQIESSTTLTEVENFDNQQLDLQADIKRFIDVYFQQEFTNPKDRLQFVQVEYMRFLDYQMSNEAEQNLQIEFVTILGKMIDKINNQNFDFQEEDQQLADFYQKQ
ncbi:hypothetical protein HN643_02915 [Candidatus Falkowbacteria bacterium]|nr:hypothetical protein [Candidatus Falkowbacteria bacterium]MBT5503373.1 hypothetical protein [Candidatus Falkowbacteria bacterium]MBT6573703.1 hypothetical protein [Candidatus Falkowbacteria bacterium]MBT7500594.1 hypothetical protein [Candidatus Falkowbacteria bacterium]